MDAGLPMSGAGTSATSRGSMERGRVKTLDSIANLRRWFAGHPLTCDAPLLAWFRFAKWQMRSRFQKEVEFDWVGGQKLVIQHGMTGATGNIYVGLHEFFDMMMPLHFLRPGDLFLDVGANVGSYTVLASGVCGARTFAFEPDPTTLVHLKKNLEVNGLVDLVRVYECALGATRGKVDFTIGLDTVNRIATAKDTRTQTVRIERVDEIVLGSPPIMMKIDVEGAEADVLSGAERLLSDPSLKVIELETVSQQSARILGSQDFETACYDPFHRTLTRNPTSCKSSNSLFVRDWPFVADRLETARQIDVLGRRI
jgi:FkbM family methyltransferase